MYQLPLFADIYTNEYSIDDYIISDHNRRIYNYILSWPHWIDNNLILIGNKGYGKTHLSYIWKNVSDAIFLTQDTLNIDYIMNCSKKNFIIDNVENFSEYEILHAFNIINQHQNSLLMTSNVVPHQIKFNIADLKSRICSVPHMLLPEHSSDILCHILIKELYNRNIHISHNLINYIMVNAKRSYDNFLTIIDEISSAEYKGKVINKLFIKDMLHKMT